ncbi:MAG: TRAP transporter substrate-binding protein DctP [Treponema sp.]|jgi:TRAP-type C4-dicarboxylate transport system substrate-binding protein|nr:TRAP transporter substrate-binding protein DctP [Treponema sp.]
MKKTLLFAACLFLIPGFDMAAQRRPRRQTTIKLASMVPENTPWGAALNKMAAEWSAATNGEVRLQIYANGTQGSEEAVLQKLNMNAIQAAVLTSFGLNRIVPEMLTLSCPFLIRGEDEFVEVFKTIKPELEAKINAGNYYSLALVRGGWVRFFSRNPVFVPADLKRQKVGSVPSEPELAQVFRTMGYQVVMVDEKRLLVALNGGSIDAVYQSPIASAGFQYFGVAKHMASINIAPFMGGIVLNKHAWESIPEQHRDAIIRITRRIGSEIEASLMQLENDAVTTMSRHGLVVNTIDTRQAQQWYDDMTKATPSLLGTTFDRATYARIEGILKNYRGER